MRAELYQDSSSVMKRKDVFLCQKAIKEGACDKQSHSLEWARLIKQLCGRDFKLLLYCVGHLKLRSSKMFNDTSSSEKCSHSRKENKSIMIQWHSWLSEKDTICATQVVMIARIESTDPRKLSSRSVTVAMPTPRRSKKSDDLICRLQKNTT